MFKYAMDGLSSAGLRVLLHVGEDPFSIRKERTDENDIETNNSTVVPVPRQQTTIADERVLWHAQYYTLGVWQQAQILYTFPEIHSVRILELKLSSGS